MKILKFILIFIAACVVGFGIGAAIAILFTDTTFSEFGSKLTNLKVGEILIAIGCGMLCVIGSAILLIIAHEAGHLVFGLMTGYKFVSFRILNFTFIKINGKIKVKRYSITGTGGQCLLSPPDLSLKEIPVFWYNAGGIIVNLIILVALLPLMWIVKNPLASECLFVAIAVDAIMLLLNGIPIKVGGLNNDGYNIIQLRKNLTAKRGMVMQLRANALIQEGVRPKDMPSEWFSMPENINYKNALETAIPLMSASRLVDMERWDEAEREFETLYNHKEETIQVYANEITCELAFIYLVKGKLEEARKLLDKPIMKYVEMYSKMMSGKGRLLFAKALYMDNDREKADKIYRKILDKRSEYLLQGEVESDLAIMKSLLKSVDDH